jgi:urocanate hydratase
MTCDPGIGVLRHADAGYPEAQRLCEKSGLRRPLVREESA